MSDRLQNGLFLCSKITSRENFNFIRAVDSYGPNGPTKTINSVQVCWPIKCAGLWADILLGLTQIQTEGFA